MNYLAVLGLFMYNDNYTLQPDWGTCFKNKSLAIGWRIPTKNAFLSEKDMKHELLEDFDSPFSIDVDLYPEELSMD